MARVALIAWEIGGGRGHVVHLTEIAAALARRGFRCIAYLVHMEHADEIAPHCGEVRQGPYFPYRTPSEQLNPSSRYGDWLGLHHFDEPQVIRTAIERWRRIIDEHAPAVVVAEQSPGAILAARSLGVPVVHVGVPVTTPPPQMPHYPSFIPESLAALYDETKLRDAVNEAIVDYGLPPLPTLPAIYAADDEVVATLDLLDRYREERACPRVPPTVGGWSEPGERLREEAFVYLSTSDRFDPVILTAIATLDLPRRVMVAANAALPVGIMRWRNATIQEQPLPPGEIARRARVLVHAGNHGISCLGLRAGLPQVTLCGQPEHVYDGRQIAGAGAGLTVEYERWSVPVIQNAIRTAWSSAQIAERAVTVAEQLAIEFDGEPGDMTADRIETLIRAGAR
jgi:UDP:flavonoid glycosyltransferase YjiC (YdhE family)